MEHKYAQVLRWIADGKKVQVLSEGVLGDSAWKPIAEVMSPDCWKEVIDEVDEYEFRLAPRTVKVGDVEIESSIRDAIHGQSVYWVNQFGEAVSFKYLVMDSLHENLMNQGKLFAAKEAAEAAHDAWVKLMTQGEA